MHLICIFTKNITTHKEKNGISISSNISLGTSRHCIAVLDLFPTSATVFLSKHNLSIFTD